MGWAHWRGAEAILAAHGDLDAATRSLPPTQAWILRATDALERGDRAALESLLDTAPEAKHLAIVEISLSAPGGLDPSRLRAKLKKAGVPNDPLPWLDFVRLACVAHNGSLPTRPGSLARASNQRVALRGALMVLSPKFTPFQLQKKLVKYSPRMTSMWAAGITQLFSPGTVRVWIAENFPELDELSRSAWPDLEDPIKVKSTSGRPGKAGLDEYLNRPDVLSWTPFCDEDLDEVIHEHEPQAQRAMLGRMLDAIHRVIDSKMTTRAHSLIVPTGRLADATPGVENKALLMWHLQLLDLRLGWLQRTLPSLAITRIWSGLSGPHSEATPTERGHAARTILEILDATGGSRVVDGAALTSLLAALMHTPEDWDRDTLPPLRKLGEQVDLEHFAVALRGVQPVLRWRALGTLQALRGNLAAALDLAVQLLGAGAVTEADGVVALAMNRTDAALKGRQARRQFERALVEYAKAGIECDPPPAARALSPLFLFAANHLKMPLARTLTPTIMRRLRIEPSPPYDGLCEHLRLLLMETPEGPSPTLFRAFTRWLRRAPSGEAIESALCFCASLSESPEVVAGLASEDGDYSQPAGWLRSVTQWLEHQPAVAVEARALTLATDGRCHPCSLMMWYELISDLPEGETWERVAALDPDAEEEGEIDFEAFEAMARMLGLEGQRPY